MMLFAFVFTLAFCSFGTENFALTVDYISDNRIEYLLYTERHSVPIFSDNQHVHISITKC